MLEALSNNAVQLLVGLVAIGGILLGLLGRGLGFLVKRRLTDAKRKERLDYISGLADLKIKLREAGLSMEEVQEVSDLLTNSGLKSSEAAQQVVAEIKDDLRKFSPYDNNMAMKIRAGAAYEVANAQLDQALIDLRLAIDDDDWPYIEKIQGAWLEYKRRIEDWNLRQYEGGTHASLAMTMAGLAETERRTKEITEEAAELALR